MAIAGRATSVFAALACAAFFSGCASETESESTGDIAPEATGEQAQELRLRKKYTLVRKGEYRGEAFHSSGGARWYMPTVAPDQDGDGIGELLVGQPYGNVTARQGAVRILSGKDLTELRAIGPDDADQEYDGTFGYSAHSLGDINFDGKTDFAVGSSVITRRDPDGSHPDPGYQYTGLTYIMKSRRNDAGFDTTRILGDDPNGFFGYWMATVSFELPRIFRHGPPGGLHGIRLPALGLVSSQAKFRAGRAWGIDPRTGEVQYRASADAANNDAVSERRGYFMAPAGDIDGNGVTDFMMTANGQWMAGDPEPTRYAGRVYFHDGLTGELIRVVEGAHDRQYLGYRCSATQIDDVNRDGVDDFIVGSARDSVTGGFASAGVAYVISGKAIRSSTDKVLKLNEHPEIILRTHVGTHLGQYLGEAPMNLFDMDADGVDDYAISAWGDGTAEKPYIGAIFIYSGRTGEVLQKISGAGAYDYFGQQLMADPASGNLYIVDPYYVDEAGTPLGRIVVYRAEPMP